MNFDKHIEQLLYRYQCVTVPGFGAFLSEIKSAEWSESNNTFFPPKKIISFNVNIQNNDGLLANHIAFVEKKTYEAAVLQIEQEVVQWKNTLQESGELSIKNIGDIVLNSENNLHFTPFATINFLSSSFGLSSIVSPYLSRDFDSNSSENATESTVIAMKPISETSERKPYLKYAAILVLGLGLTASTAYKIYQNRIESETLLVKTAVQKQVQNKIQEATFFIKAPIASVTLSVKSNKMPYHVVAGAFRSEKNAEKKCRQLANLGFKARKIAVNKYGLYPVLYGSYSNYQEAEKVKDAIQKKSNPEAWVLIESL